MWDALYHLYGEREVRENGPDILVVPFRKKGIDWDCIY